MWTDLQNSGIPIIKTPMLTPHAEEMGETEGIYYWSPTYLQITISPVNHNRQLPLRIRNSFNWQTSRVTLFEKLVSPR